MFLCLLHRTNLYNVSCITIVLVVVIIFWHDLFWVQIKAFMIISAKSEVKI